MVQSKATTVDDYISELPDDRREAISKVRAVVKKNLPKGYRELVGYGMINWVVPLERYPETYNGQPLCYIGLASQKNHMALYLMGVYGNKEREQFLHDGFKKAGKKLDMGKSCLRFKKLDDLPLDVIGKLVAGMPVDELIAVHEKVHGAKKKGRG